MVLADFQLERFALENRFVFLELERSLHERANRDHQLVGSPRLHGRMLVAWDLKLCTISRYTVNQRVAYQVCQSYHQTEELYAYGQILLVYDVFSLPVHHQSHQDHRDLHPFSFEGHLL
jgi:hypothetical protein